MWNPWGRQAMEMRLIHIYPDLMNLYGSYANVLVLQQFLEDMGYEVTVEIGRAACRERVFITV